MLSGKIWLHSIYDIAFSRENLSHLNQEKDMHRSSTAYNRKQLQNSSH